MTHHAETENYSMLKLFVKEDQTIDNDRVFESIIKFLKREDIILSVYLQRVDASIDENLSVVTDAIEVLSYGSYIVVTAVGEGRDIEKISKWLADNCGDGIITVEKPEILFLNKTRKLMVLKKLTAEKIMTANVFHIFENTRLSEIIKLIYDKKIRFLPVLNQKTKEVKGIITEGDLIKNSLIPIKTRFWGMRNLKTGEFNELIDNIRQYDHIIAYDIMKSGEIFSVAPGAKITDIILKMNKNRLKRILVIDDERKFTGIISRLDIFRALSSKALPEGISTEENGGDISPKDDIVERAEADHLAAGIKKFIDYKFEPVTLKTKIVKIIEMIDPGEFTFIPVVDENKIFKGVITDSQLFSFKTTAAPGKNIFRKIFNMFIKETEFVNLEVDMSLTAEDIMKPVENNYLSEDSPLGYALNKMIGENLKMIAVTNEILEFKGVISRRNIIRNLIN